jgi:hypothetical protein
MWNQKKEIIRTQITRIKELQKGTFLSAKGLSFPPKIFSCFEFSAKICVHLRPIIFREVGKGIPWPGIPIPGQPG